MSNKLNALNAGQVLGRSEMKKIMAGSGGSCVEECTWIAQQCAAAVCYGGCGSMAICNQQLDCCTRQCSGLPC
jgi:hypothetical protein